MPAFHAATVASKTTLENSSSLISTTAQSLFLSPIQSTKSVSSWSAVAVVLMDVKINSTHQAPREGFKNVYIANLV